MSTTKDGGPAFPFTGDVPLLCVDAAGRPTGETLGTVPAFQPGMTLRDYFAGQALVGLISKYGNEDSELAGRICYEFADAMLAAREAK